MASLGIVMSTRLSVILVHISMSVGGFPRVRMRYVLIEIPIDMYEILSEIAEEEGKHVREIITELLLDSLSRSGRMSGVACNG